MKIKPLIFAAALTFTYALCAGQTEPAAKVPEQLPITSGQAPYYLLKAGDNSLELDPNADAKFDWNLVDPNTIESIQVFKGDEAKACVGAKGQHGVVIITFKDFHFLSKELQTKFTDSKK
ncbi:MAG: hypothetical protein JNJ65_00355 [Cyclobacteriaceae bacterium]|jgi:hypothetical protein|nr:hypothetical protein [Cyclobacteriaceae bacterium]